MDLGFLDCDTNLRTQDLNFQTSVTQTSGADIEVGHLVGWYMAQPWS